MARRRPTRLTPSTIPTTRVRMSRECALPIIQVNHEDQQKGILTDSRLSNGALAYNLSLRALEKMMAERGVSVNHSTIHRWIVRFPPLLL